MLKVELHSHTSDASCDHIPHTARELIDHAVELDYQALAITLHDKQLDVEPLRTYARERDVVLIPRGERTIDPRHVLLINFPPRAERVETFEDVARLKAEAPTGIVVAPHPFYPKRNCQRARMDRYADIFDAVEGNAIYARLVNFNGAAVRWARAHGKPTVGNGDVHRLEQLGSTYSLVEAEPDPDAICQAIRAGKVRVETQPLSMFRLAAILAKIVPGGHRHAARYRTNPEG